MQDSLLPKYVFRGAGGNQACYFTPKRLMSIKKPKREIGAIFM